MGDRPKTIPVRLPDDLAASLKCIAAFQRDHTRRADGFWLDRHEFTKAWLKYER